MRRNRKRGEVGRGERLEKIGGETLNWFKKLYLFEKRIKILLCDCIERVNSENRGWGER